MPTEISDSSLFLWKDIAYLRLGAFTLFVSPFKQKLGSFIHVTVKSRIAILFINHTLHSDLHVPHVRTVFQERTANHRTALDSHPNPLIELLVHPPDKRRLKRRWTFDEIH
jgi:hypothetical protein